MARTNTIRILILTLLIVGVAIIGMYYVALKSLFGGSGVTPRLVLVVPSPNYDLDLILKAIDRLGAQLGDRINMQEGGHFTHYEHAYWYPYQESATYGVALAMWDTAGWENDELEVSGKFFIEVYSENEPCSLCAKLKQVLVDSQIEFSSPCEERGVLTEYEEIRCGI